MRSKLKTSAGWFLALLGLLLVGTLDLSAAAVLTVPDPTTVLDTAITAVNAVTALIAGVVGFFIVVRIVKWISR